MSLAPIRKNKNLSLAVVASRMGVTRSGVQQIEKAENPLVSTLTRYAEAIGEDPLTIINTVINSSKKSVQNA
jgi:transcriptional regulator with XRE-family HTH domain